MSRSNQLPNLDKLFRDDDDQEFTPQGGANLAAIFGTPQRLDITPPVKKAPGKPSPAPPKTEVILVKIVHAYKLESGQYSLIGKLGIALTRDPTHSFLLILYKTKQEHISVVPLTPDFQYSPGDNNYASYYDSTNSNWSILFESSDSAIEFAREIGVTRYLLRGRPETSVFSQDLTPKKDTGEKVEEGDEVELNYCVIPTITQPLKLGNSPSQGMRVRITSDDTWEKSLVGVHKGLKRLLILPPSKQISLGPGFPREQAVALEVEILDIVKPETKKETSPKTTVKASLISRMAKMGHSMLPKVPTTDSEDTEEEVQVRRKARGKSEPERNTKTITSPQTPGSLVPVFHPWAKVPQAPQLPQVPLQQFVPDSHVYQYQAPILQVPDPNLNVFLSETRTHNAEIRMGISKVADNVQKLLDKFHVLELERCTSPRNERSLEGLKALLEMRNEGRGQERGLKTEKSDESEKERLEIQGRVRRLEEDLREAQGALQKALADLREANGLVIQYQRENATLEGRILRLEEEKKKIESRNPREGTQVKQVMNKTYQALVGRFSEASYEKEYIKDILGNTIREITLQVLQNRGFDDRKGDDRESEANNGQGADRDFDMTSAPDEEPPPIPPMDLDVDDWLS
ncbi:FK506-binding protein 15-like [Fopius arisanus]|uniref:FK506-binding protein 15-like n=1 Tax=Fopius arisanus TaxID=64838 RepID=A0A9R1TYB6_9HYME|nr:PREDICTED: FK506-binding protein 15-like [Fopius arisanus]